MKSVFLKLLDLWQLDIYPASLINDLRPCIKNLLIQLVENLQRLKKLVKWIGMQSPKAKGSWKGRLVDSLCLIAFCFDAWLLRL